MFHTSVYIIQVFQMLVPSLILNFIFKDINSRLPSTNSFLIPINLTKLVTSKQKSKKMDSLRWVFYSCLTFRGTVVKTGKIN